MSYWRIISLLMLSFALSSLWLTLNTYNTTPKESGVWLLVLRSSPAFTPSLSGWGRTRCPAPFPGRYCWGHTYPETLPLWCTQLPQLSCSFQHSWELSWDFPAPSKVKKAGVQRLALEWARDSSAAIGKQRWKRWYLVSSKTKAWMPLNPNM